MPADEVPAPPVERPIPWMNLAWFTVLILIAYAPVLVLLVNQWSTDEDVGHGFFVPLVAAYIAWQHREEILSQPFKSSPWGLALVLWGAFQLYVGTLGAELFLQRTAFIITIVGAILFTCGWGVLRQLAFPLCLLPFMVPLPAVVFNQITFPLQLFASWVAASTLELIGIPVLRDGNVLELASQKLSVVEACSGIRSLLSLTFLSLVYAYFFDKKPWMRITLFAITIPVAIIANAARVTITGILSEIRTDLAQGFFHLLEGWIIFIVALTILVTVHGLLNHIYAFFWNKNELSQPVSH